jgi:hypothetical protein
MAARLTSGEIAGKLLILGSLAVAALTAYRSLPSGGIAPRALASLVYVLNPFVYGRLHYGQVFLVSAYAVLPWVASRLRQLLIRPNLSTSLLAAASLSLLGILDVHLLVPAAALTGALLITHVTGRWRNIEYLTRLGWALFLTVLVASLTSVYWLVPLVTGSGVQGNTIARVSEVDVTEFHTVADPHLGIVPNLLGLYGFWGEATYRFTSMKYFAPLWPAALVGLLLLATVGASAVISARLRMAFDGARPWVSGLVLAGVVGLILDVGVADPHVAPLIHWLDTALPPYRGMRDAGKWAALLALVYSQLVPLGVMALAAWAHRSLAGRPLSLAQGGITALGLALPLYYGNGLLFGAHGQIRPSSYPTGWYDADRVLVADQSRARAVFLPWHLYLSLSFIQNSNRVVASPAPSFFSVPVVISTDPEFPPIRHVEDADQLALSALVASGGHADWASRLADRNIKYVLLAREVDWQRYGYLGQQPGLELVGDYGSILLYRNTLWHTVTSTNSG